MFLFLGFISARNLYVNIKESKSKNCFEKEGCDLESLRSTIKRGDNIFILDKYIDKENSQQLLEILNQTTNKVISINGHNTTIVSPNYPLSESAAIYAEDTQIHISGFRFTDFRIPILNGQRSVFNVSDCTFENSDASLSAILAFIACNMTIRNVKLTNLSANTQSIFIAFNSTILFEKSNITNNFIESKDIRAALHFITSNISFTDSYFQGNDITLPLIAGATNSSIHINQSYFYKNSPLTIIALESNSNCTFTDTKFKLNRNGLISAIKGGISILRNVEISEHYTQACLFGFTDSNCSILSTNFTDSDISQVALFISQEIQDFTLNLENVGIFNSTSVNSIFTQNGGRIIVNNLNVSKLNSDAEIVIISHQNGIETTMNYLTLESISSTIVISTALASVNVSNISLTNFDFHSNSICGALFENGTITVKNSSFVTNECLPRGNSIPLAILTTSSAPNVYLENNTFKDNTALTGAVFFASVTGKVVNNKFYKNQAVQGGSLVGNLMNITVENSKFARNTGYNEGGVASFLNGSVSFSNCKFIENQATDGGVISSKNCTNITIFNSTVKRNTAEHGTFIHDENSDVIWISDTEIDDSLSEAMYITKEYDFSRAKFNCKVRCLEPKPEDVKKLLKRDEGKIPEATINAKAKEGKDDEEIKIDQENDEEDINIKGDKNTSKIVFLIIPFVLLFLIFIIIKRVGYRNIFVFINNFGSKDNRYIL